MAKNEIQWLGHSAVKITTPGGRIIFIDPFLLSNPTTPNSHKLPEKADYILLTHGHEDHVGDTLDLSKRTGALVIGNVELIGLLKSDGLPEAQALEFNKGGTINFDEFKVTLVSANHSSSNKGRYAGEAGGIIIRMLSGECYYHMGDTNLMADFIYYYQLYKPDVLFIPIGDHYTMGPVEAALCCEMLKPGLAVPIHYGTFPPLTGNPQEFKKLIEQKGTSRVKIPKPGETFSI